MKQRLPQPEKKAPDDRNIAVISCRLGEGVSVGGCELVSVAMTAKRTTLRVRFPDGVEVFRLKSGESRN